MRIENTEKGFLIGGRYWRDKEHAERAHELIIKSKAHEISHLIFFEKIELPEQGGLLFLIDYSYREGERLIFEQLKTRKDVRFKDVVRLWKLYGTGTLRSTKRLQGVTVIRNEYKREGGGNV